MAEKEKKTADAAHAEGAGAAAPAKKKLDILGLLSLVLILANIGAVATLGTFGKKLWQKVGEIDSQTQKLVQIKRDMAAVKPVGEELKPKDIGVLFSMESFLVNITSDQGPKFLQTQMEFELSDPAVEDELVKRKPAVRDSIIVMLSSRSYKELRDPNGMKRLRQDLLKMLNHMLSSGKVKDVYFTQFHFN
jgi:flagellar basal body-associated protein FliL